MKKTIAIIFVCLLFTGCAGLNLPGKATLSLPENATPEQIKEAKCQDARSAVIDSQIVMSSESMNEDQATWWHAYITACKDLAKQYCLN
jgi:PBP1b-binding outer membrane lipoprotein LpoB